MSTENRKGNAASAVARPTPSVDGNATTAAAIKRDLQVTASSSSNGLGRLAPARDLTLGGRGAGAAKKVFMPNLNAVRNKNANVKTSKDVTATRGRRGAGRGTRGGSTRGAGRGGANSALIQTAGLFSEGAGALNLRKSFGNSSASERISDESSVSQMRKPVLTKSTQKIDMKEETARMRSILGDSDEELFVEDKTELGQTPIKLTEANWKTIKPEIKLDQPNGVAPLDTDDSVAIAQHLQTLHVQQQQHSALPPPSLSTIYPPNVEAFLSKSDPQIFLMQIPDILPCVVDDEPSNEKEALKPETNVTSENGSSSNTSSEPKTIPPLRNVFKDMEEGQIGKLIRYKSGKIKLVLGETRFDLDVGMETGFLQELMSISANREERSGNMINLGPIEAKLNATPDWEYLFEQQEMAARSSRNS